MFNFIKEKKEKAKELELYYNSLINDFSNEDIYDNQSEKLLNFFGDAKELKKTIKLILVSDTNNNLDELRFADYVYRYSDYDACIILGNISENDLNIIKKYVNNKKIYSLDSLPDIENINKKIIKINNVKVLGYKTDSYNHIDSIKELNSLSSSDVLITYSNRYIEGQNGIFGINYYIFKNNVPYHIHGSSLKPYKDRMINNTKEISIYEFEYVVLPLNE